MFFVARLPYVLGGTSDLSGRDEVARASGQAPHRAPRLALKGEGGEFRRVLMRYLSRLAKVQDTSRLHREVVTKGGR